MITENVSTLKIHRLTQAQYERERSAGNLDETALYLTPDTGDIEVSAIILRSSTPGSTKKFRVTIGNDGVLVAEEIIQ